MTRPMSLRTAHRLLIGVAIGAFAFYAAFGVRRALAVGGVSAWGFALGSVAAAIGFAFYLRAFNRRMTEQDKRSAKQAPSRSRE